MTDPIAEKLPITNGKRNFRHRNMLGKMIEKISKIEMFSNVAKENLDFSYCLSSARKDLTNAYFILNDNYL